jgi:hypothetical protein
VQIHEFLKFLSKKAAAAAPLQPQQQRQRRYGHLCFMMFTNVHM